MVLVALAIHPSSLRQVVLLLLSLAHLEHLFNKHRLGPRHTRLSTRAEATVACGGFFSVNHRFGQGYLRKWDWPKLLREYRRVARSGGVIRITEVDFAVESSSPALNRLNHLLVQAFHQAGHYFTPEGNGVISQLARLLHQYGVRNVQTRIYTLEHRVGTPEGQSFYEDVRLVYRTTVPFLRKWIRMPDDYEAIYQQALNEMQQPDFVGRLGLLTAWGTNP